jgi:hypothetical protein
VFQQRANDPEDDRDASDRNGDCRRLGLGDAAHYRNVE